ncbi:putative cytochrome P450 [Poronia punctata]|nr:putative cytochrome P450 [Poronia punctata]
MDMATSTRAVGSLVVILLSTLLWKLLRIGHRPKGLPPGPPTIPILGNLHLIPSQDVHLQFQQWAEEYGPIYSLMLGSKTMIVLSSDHAIKDLLDKRSAIYSDRMDMYIGQTIISGGLRVLMMHYGPTWRKVRGIMHKLLNVHAARAFAPFQVLENQQMLHDILNDPKDYTQHVRRYANSLITMTTFGYRVPTHDDPYFQELFHILEEFLVLAQTGTSALLDYMPALRYLPSWVLPQMRRAKAQHKRERVLYRYYWDKTKAEILASENPVPCFSAGLIEEQSKHGLDDDFASYITGTLLEAGSETTANTLIGFLCAMMVFPEVQKHAHAELDRVVGNRMPLPEDEPQLQYIRGCVKESLRWMPTTPLGAVPHALTRDDEYMGYKLPKGAGVINNVFAIHNDPNRYPDPHRFDPDRYKDDRQSFFEAATTNDESKRDHFTFGAGRRICPGIHVAERSLFLGISRLLWAFEFKRPVDDDGNEIIPDPSKITQGFVSAPLPFEAVITPRDEEKADIIRKEWATAQEKNLNPKTMQWLEIPKGIDGINS